MNGAPFITQIKVSEYNKEKTAHSSYIRKAVY